MRVLIDIGNSTIVVAKANAKREIEKTWRFKTQKEEALGFFRKELQLSVARLNLSEGNIDSVTISSVVPEINDKMTQAVMDVMGIEPHFFSLDDVKDVLTVDIEAPSQLGKDRLADAAGAVRTYGTPAIVFDMGTATTVGVITHDRRFIGGMIMPGVKTSLKALCKRASQLPIINIERPRHMIGQNTLECMQSGVLYGGAAMIDGIIDRVIDILQADSPVMESDIKIVATGGMAKQVIPYCRHKIIIDSHLQFKGL